MTCKPWHSRLNMLNSLRFENIHRTQILSTFVYVYTYSGCKVLYTTGLDDHDVGLLLYCSTCCFLTLSTNCCNVKSFCGIESGPSVMMTITGAMCAYINITSSSRHKNPQVVRDFDQINRSHLRKGQQHGSRSAEGEQNGLQPSRQHRTKGMHIQHACCRLRFGLGRNPACQVSQPVYETCL